MTIKPLFYNEYDSGKELYEKGFKGDESFWKNVFLVSKYVQFELGWGKARTITFIEDICESNKINIIRNRDIIRSMVSNSAKKPIVRHQPVEITESEISHIRLVKNFFAQKVLLATLFLLKRNNDNSFNYFNATTISEIRSLLGDKNITKNAIRSAQTFILRTGLGLYFSPNTEPIFFVTIPSGGKRVLYITNNDEAKRLISTYVDDVVGGELGFCVECGAEFFTLNQNSKYCEHHKKERAKNRHKRYNDKRYGKFKYE